MFDRGWISAHADALARSRDAAGLCGSADVMAIAWLNPAGGLRYHLRALGAGHGWQPFRESLAMWLARFEARSKRALLVGPSAGYTLPDAFLRRFTEVIVLEPDPIAAFLLTRRLRGLGIANLRVERRDRLIAPLIEGGPGFTDMLRADPDLCLIFGNVLGQARFMMAEANFTRFKAKFREHLWPLLPGRSWLAFHDRVSGNLAPQFEAPYCANSRLTDAQVVRDLYRPGADGPAVELFDHQSQGFFPSELPHCYFSWQIDRNRSHLIEGVASVSPKQGDYEVPGALSSSALSPVRP